MKLQSEQERMQTRKGFDESEVRLKTRVALVAVWLTGFCACAVGQASEMS
jgi:hypothetical protein